MDVVTRRTAVVTRRTGVVTRHTGVVTRRTGVATRRTGMATRRTGMATRRTGAVTRRTGVATRRTGVVTRSTGVVTRRTGVAIQQRRRRSRIPQLDANSVVNTLSPRERVGSVARNPRRAPSFASSQRGGAGVRGLLVIVSTICVKWRPRSGASETEVAAQRAPHPATPLTAHRRLGSRRSTRRGDPLPPGEGVPDSLIPQQRTWDKDIEEVRARSVVNTLSPRERVGSVARNPRRAPSFASSQRGGAGVRGLLVIVNTRRERVFRTVIRQHAYVGRRRKGACARQECGRES